jgi:hypothetical protein
MKLRLDERRAPAQDAGQVLPLVAVALAALMGFAGLGVDVGYLEYRQQAQQSATDAAAIGGAQQLARSSCPNASVAKTAALADASTNGFGSGVTVQNPPSSGPYANSNCSVYVSIASTQATFFSQLFGYATGMPESTQAVASVSTNGTGSCIYLLSANTWSSFNSGTTVYAPGCAIEAYSGIRSVPVSATTVMRVIDQ